MKKSIAVSTLLIGMFAQGAFAESNGAGVGDGTITFTGTVTDAPCVVAASDQYQTVSLGQIKTADVTGAEGPAGRPGERIFSGCPFYSVAVHSKG